MKIDDRVRMLEESIVLDKRYKHDISVVVDRLVMRHDLRKRLADSIETAVQRAEGLVEIEIVGAGEGGKGGDGEEADGTHATGAKGARAPSGQILPGEVPEPGTGVHLLGALRLPRARALADRARAARVLLQLPPRRL